MLKNFDFFFFKVNEQVLSKKEEKIQLQNSNYKNVLINKKIVICSVTFFLPMLKCIHFLNIF